MCKFPHSLKVKMATKVQYTRMSKEVANMHKSIVFSICVVATSFQWKSDGKEKVRLAMELSEDGMRKALQFLYLNLLQFTKGDSHSRIVAGGMDDALDTYRQLIERGKNQTVLSMMEQRTKIMQPDKATKLEDVESKLMQWKSDIRALRELRQKQDLEFLANHDQMITILIGMVPDILSDHLIQKFAPGVSTFDEMLKILEDYMLKLDQ